MLSSLLGQIVALFQAHPVAQAIGVGAMALTGASYQGRTPRRILLLQGAGGIVWALHFAILGAYTGSALNILGAVRSAIYLRNGESPWASSRFWPFVFSAICIGVAAWSGIWGGEGWVCVLSMIAQSWASFVLRSKNVRTIRFCSVGISTLWLAYDALSGSIPGTICESINQVSIWTAIIRYRGLR